MTGTVRRTGFLGVACLLAATTVVTSGTWCDLVFKDVAPVADVIVLAEVHASKGHPPELHVAEVFKGYCADQTLNLNLEELGQRLRDGDQMVLALNRSCRLIRDSQGLGMCSAINVLHIRDGKLKSRDRLDYDSRRGTMTLDQLREELANP